MTPHTPPESESLTLYEKHSELKRILESKHFAKAPKRRRFLEFTSAQVFQGEASKLNEYLIGVEVYDRGQDFDPQQDPIVRVQAHEIRRALKNYYQEEGRDSLVRVELQPGHYAPIFRRVICDSLEATPPAVPGELPPPTAGPRTIIAWQYTVILLLFVACAVLSTLYVHDRLSSRTQLESTTPAGPLPESVTWFWDPFLVKRNPPLVIVPTSPLLRLGTDGDTPETLRGGTAIPKSMLPEFHDTVHFRELRNFIFIPTTTDYTGIGEALGLVNLSQLFAGQGLTIRTKTGRLTNYEEVQSGNTIMLGGANQWTNRVFGSRPGFYVNGGVFRNNASGPAEPPAYAPKFDSLTNRLTQDYALISMGPNHSREERLLLLYGLYTQGTEAAAEFVTNRERLAELRKALIAASPDKKTPPPFFEALISVPVENYVPGGASLVAVKIIRE